MAKYVCNEEMRDRLVDLRRGLHTAMTALITNGDLNEAQLVLRQMDDHMRVTFANLSVANVR